jgi:hypothetical protein
MKLSHRTSLCLACLLPAISLAQLEEVVVTGSRVDFYGMPAIAIVKEADFLVQNIRLVNDSRAPDLRRDEIIETIEAMLRRADAMPGMALSYGTGFLEPIDLTDESLELIEDRERIDTSFVDIYAKVEFDASGDARDQIAALREFISGAEVVGRTAIEPLGDIGLSIVGPEQYRYEIIRAIADENRRLQEALGSGCKVSVDGLEARVEWERTDVSELTLYIPYGIEISEC